MAQQMQQMLWTVAQAETPAWTLLVALLCVAMSGGAALLMALRRRNEAMGDDRIRSIGHKIDGLAEDVRRVDCKVSRLQVEVEKRLAPLEARMDGRR